MDKNSVISRINDLRKKKKAVILAHNYQIPEVQDIADFVGDSLDLSLKATKTDAKNIVFCGVDFMAESAKILNPEKKVVLPVKDATCPMAAMVDAEALRCLIKDHPDAEVVAYINTTAEVKALADICCTSANGVKIVKSISSKKVIFVPDINLGSYIQRFVPEKKMILWPGICRTHHNITKEDILGLKKKHPGAEVLVHPECRLEVIDIADKALSTNGMVNHVRESRVKEFIIGTEKGLCYRLKKENPGKEFYPVESAVCPNMKKIDLEKILNSLITLEPEVKLPSDIMEEAKLPLQRMMDAGRGD
ncbi:MAG: quinolinate synthase NadA [Candidatus Thermoplasmatota archaeon]|jgi:quinolinate synthase|nr:quinolinate synthase NadA [Candidatus Thermoplasmatota archaeon]